MSDSASNSSAKLTQLPSFSGQIVGHFIVGPELGRGGEGVVYQATDSRTNRSVALKFLIRDHAPQIPPISHPRVLLPLEPVQQSPDGLLYFPLPLMKQNLRDFVGQGRQFPIDEAARIIHDCADALIAAHKHCQHRDLKPENILLDEKGEVHIGDWDMAQSQESRHSLEARSSVAGSWAYMAPELFRKYSWLDHELDSDGFPLNSIGAATDFYSLGLILYELLTGKYAFGDRKSEFTKEGRLHDLENPPDSPSVLRPEIPPALAEVCRKCLSVNPADRFASASELKTALSPFLSPVHKHLSKLIAICEGKTRRYSRLRASLDSRILTATDLLPEDLATDDDLTQLLVDWRLRHEREQPRQSEKFEDIREAFRQTRRAALLGDPGAGKSTMLRRLALDLAECARNDANQPLPVLVDLDI